MWTIMAGVIHEITNLGSKSESQKFISSLNNGIKETGTQKIEEQIKDETQEKPDTISDDNTSGSSPVNRDSGISVSSNGSFYDNVGQPFRRQGSGRESLGRSTMTSLKEEGRVSDCIKPKRPTKLVRWAKVTSEQATS